MKDNYLSVGETNLNKNYMKKITLFVFIALLSMACRKEGEITDQSQGHIKINGKEYRFIRIVPSEGATPVWILVPNDATVEVPRVLSMNVSCGKNCTTQSSTIFIES
jgi:hypothetical protein